MKRRAIQFLRWSERYTKTDMIHLTKDGFWLGIGHITQVGSSIVLVIAFANLLPKDVYGTYQFILAMAAILGSFTLSGISTAVTRAVAQGQGGAFRYGLRVQLVWSMGIASASSAVALYYFINENNLLAISFLIVGAFSPFLIGFRLYRAYLRGRRLFRESALLGVWGKPIPLLSLLIALLLTDNPLLLVLIYFASHTLSSGIIYFLVLRRHNPPITKSPEVISYSKHLSALDILGVIGSNLDKLLIFHFLGAAPVAIYTLALAPVTHLGKTFSILNQMALPRLATREFTILKETLPHKVRIALIVSFFVVVAYIVAAPYLFKLLFPAYEESVLISQALALVVLSAPRNLYMQAFTAHGATREIYITRLCLPILTIVLLLILLPLYGIWGAVFATLGAHLGANAIIRYTFHRTTLSTE
jgi:O-antigen/teichoic acid export membrane protein